MIEKMWERVEKKKGDIKLIKEVKGQKEILKGNKR